ncbi:DnaJsubfamily B member 13 [Sesamum angolense]|uniref:DnaJsubfamily B member 13 n=1 Tax=Sesamum angolense TaxID=2727404 RepID=A0AAE1WCX9_9LAMI|nr:DnaJsubfamily B member 13 [Sesamum angolense]
MGEHSRSHSQDLFHVLGFGRFCKACKSFLFKCYPEKHFLLFRRSGSKNKHRSTEDDIKINSYRNRELENRKADDTVDMQEVHDSGQDGVGSLPRSCMRRSCDDHMTRSPQWSPVVLTSTSPSPVSQVPSRGPQPAKASLSRTKSQRNSMEAPTKRPQPAKASLSRTRSQRNSMEASSAALSRSFSRCTSRPGATPILYSNSNGLLKPPAMEQQLDCTLEELCFGCIKKMKITRDAVTDDGQMVEEDEVLTIKVKPGWTKGTKITFEGMGDEIPGTDPADVIFVVAEKDHPLFRRQDDDLELEVEIPLIGALTGCTISVPLLDGQTMSLTIDDIVHPGYEKSIAEQGMPKQNEPATRGNLVITFSVKFPEELTEKQRSDAANILHHTC